MMLKNIYKTAVITVLGISLMILTGCGNSLVSSLNGSGNDAAAIKVNITFPDFEAMREKNLASGGTARVIDPSAEAVALLLPDGQGGYALHQELSLGDGTLLDEYEGDISSNEMNTSWSGTFTGIPAGVYAAGDIRFELRASVEGSVLVSGSNTDAVTLVPGVAVDGLVINCTPASYMILELSNNYTATDQSAAYEELNYFYFLAGSGSSYTATVTKTGGTGYPDLYVLNSQGEIVANAAYLSEPISISSPVYDADEVLYLAVYGSVGTVDFTIAVSENTTASSNANLSSLGFGEGSLNETFARSELNYTADVTNDIAEVNINWITAETNATVGLAMNSEMVINPVGLVEGENTITVTVTAEDGSTTVDYILTISRGAPVVTDFNTALETDGLVWTSGGDAVFTVVNDISHDGVDAVRSGLIPDYQTSSLSTTVTMAAEGGTVSFFWKVDSEPGWDDAKFYIDGFLMDEINGNIDWTEAGFDLTSGSHTLEWKYEKDGSTSVGLDCFWVDQVLITASAPSLTPVVKTIVDNGTLFSGNREVAIGESSGNLLAAYYDAASDDLKGVLSTDSGETWGEPFVIDDTAANLGDYIRVDCDDTGFYISYVDYTNEQVKFAKVASDGTTGTPVAIGNDGTYENHTAITVSGNDVYILYKLYNMDSSDAFMLASSSDGGSSWSTPSVVVQDETTFDGLAVTYIGSDIGLTSSGSSLFAVVSLNSRLRIITSADKGASWTFIPEIELSSSYDASITAEGGTLIMTSRSSSYGLRAVISTDSGMNWATYTAVSSMSSYTQTSAPLIDESAIYIPFRYYNSSSDKALKIVKSTDGGFTWNETSIDPIETGYQVSAVMHNGNVCIAYRDYAGSGLKFARSNDGETWQQE